MSGRVATLGRLVTVAAQHRPDLLADPVRAAIGGLAEVGVAEIDPSLADTAAFCAAYDVDPTGWRGLAASGNCVVVAGRRGQLTTFAACLVPATTRADVNGVVRRRLQARRASFADREVATGETGMEYGGITPIGLPADWLLLVDAAVPQIPVVVIGSGLRRSKIVLPGRCLADLPGAEVIEGLGRSGS